MNNETSAEAQRDDKALESRLLQVEGQIHALARSWLYLASGMEMQGQLDGQRLERMMLDVHWNGAALEPHAQHMMKHLVGQLSSARENRRLRDGDLSTGLAE
ncbi:MAG: hypothetical protein HLX50_06535 [Alteromonadaceae bacterium]|nr:hypothetical protein [Alteromonadaceae bacterium]